MSPSLSVIIPTHRRPDSLDRLLASLTKQVAAPPFEVIVIMNLQEDESRLKNWATKLPLTWKTAGQLGVNRARNAGLENARGSVILLLDDDTELADPQLLKKHWDHHQAHPEVAGFGGGYAFLPELSDLAFAYHLIAMTWLLRYRREPDGRTPYLIGGHASYKSSVVRDGFRFSEAIQFGGSETEFNWRLFEAGRKLVYDPFLRVNHHIDLDWRDLARKAFLQGFHSSRRKRDMGAPAATMKQSRAVREVRAMEPEDRGARWRIRLGLHVFQFFFDQGWKNGIAGESFSTRLFARLAGAKVKR